MEAGDWSSFNGVFVNEEADFMAQLFPTNNVVESNTGLGCWSNSSNSNLHYSFPQESSYSGVSCVTNYPTNYYISDNDNFLAPNYENATFHESGEVDLDEQEHDYPKKRARGSDAPKGKRNANKSKKIQRLEDDKNGGLNKQITSNCSSEDESHLSLELNNGVSSSTKINANSKTRASRGSATDPQSLYARKRRERINERLKILQGLVPNGTKVDISTMLEEAVEYVKFLQLQIKLLSSEDLWMYAPIAYNGMDIGLDIKINAAKS